MQPIDLTNVTSVILSTPYDKPIEVPVKVLETIFELGIDVRDKVLALKYDGEKETNLQSENKRLLSLNEQLVEALKPLVNLSDAVFVDARKDKEGVLYGFNAAEITYNDLRKAKAAIEANQNTK